MTHNSSYPCPICNSVQGSVFKVREMMYGTRDEYNYIQCENCKCLFLAGTGTRVAPKEESYPSNYYSFSMRHEQNSRVRGFVRHHKLAFYLWNKDILGRMFQILRPFDDSLLWLGKAGVGGFNSRFLDVGCGSGKLLHSLFALGFRDLTGIDPFLEKEISISSSFSILKKDIFDVHDRFDCIMFHHSIEHMNDPQAVLSKAKEITVPGGSIVIRTPCVDSYAWEHYGTNWVQIDAPRHVIIYSEKCMNQLVQNAGLEIGETYRDSTEFQFWGSEQYLNDIPLRSDTSFSIDPGKSMFKDEDIRKYSEDARKLNKQQKGDQIVYILRNVK